MSILVVRVNVLNSKFLSHILQLSYKYNINSWRKSYNCPQDIDMQLRMKSSGVKMKSLDKVVSYIRPRPGLNTIGLAARLVNEEGS